MDQHTITNLETLLEEIRAGLRPEYLYFWGHKPPPDGRMGKHCLSQWWPASFMVDGITYPAAEHYMMAEKARLFGDEETRQKMLATPGPHAVKKLGRLVRGFDDATWAQHRFMIVVRGNQARFQQNPALAAYLRSTHPQILVEASPFDPIWGIGLKESDPRAADPAQWRGLNLLGFALMVVRAGLEAGAAEV